MPSDVMIGKTNVTNLLRKKYEKIGNGWISLMKVPAGEHMQVNAEALRILTKELKYDCIYITLSKTYSDLDKFFKSVGVDINNIHYIDAISQMYGTIKTSTKKCVYVSNPLNIDAITIALREALSNITNEKKCVFLDSVTTILLYNSLARTVRFSKFLTKTLKSLGINGIMVSIAKGEVTEKVIKELSTLCDEVVSLTLDNEGVKKLDLNKKEVKANGS
jgi:KaiC/GvpD/RAD55 family RecA-like ATPase